MRLTGEVEGVDVRAILCDGRHTRGAHPFAVGQAEICEIRAALGHVGDAEVCNFFAPGEV